MKRDFGIFQVALKVLLRKSDQVLFCVSDKNRLDLPGGRIDNVEHRVPLERIIAREVREELGSRVKYKLGGPIFQFRRHLPSRGVYNFITVYNSVYLSGAIRLSPEHTSYRWINPRTNHFKEKDFCNKEEYRAFTRYFKNHA